MASNKSNQLSRKLKRRSNPQTTSDVLSPITELTYNLKTLSPFSTDTPKRMSSFRAPPKVFVSAECLDFGSPLEVVKPRRLIAPKGIEQLVEKPLSTPKTSRTKFQQVDEERLCIRGLFKELPDSEKGSKVQNTLADTPQKEPMRRKTFSMRTARKTRLPVDKVTRSYSQSEATNIMKAVELGTDNPDLVADFTRPYALPMIAGKHQDLKSISTETMSRVLNGELISGKKYVVIDCRFPYEYEGGHITGAVNIYSKEGLEEQFFQKLQSDDVLIFHCEFSSERGPSMCRFLRSKDREVNEYPKLFYPEIYVLNGGYKAFFEFCKELCVPQSYMPMVHGDHEEDLRLFRTKSKNWRRRSLN